MGEEQVRTHSFEEGGGLSPLDLNSSWCSDPQSPLFFSNTLSLPVGMGKDMQALDKHQAATMWQLCSRLLG